MDELTGTEGLFAEDVPTQTNATPTRPAGRNAGRSRGNGGSRCATCGRDLATQGPCAWCSLGKPAAVGAAGGTVAGVLLPGLDVGRGLIWGTLAGLAYGFFRR